MKILIVGAGAVGGFYGTKLTLAGEDVTFLARGATLEALRKHDLVVKSFRGDFHTRVKVIGDLSSLSPPDLVMICVKTYDTDKVLKQIRPVVGKETLLLSLQNGIENEKKMAASFGKKRVLGAVCYIGAEVLEPGVILHNARGSVAIGEMDGKATERAKRIVEIFHKAKIDVQLSKNIVKELWTKLSWNTAFNQICTIARATVGSILESKVMRQLLRDTMKEVFAVARKNRILLGEKAIAESLKLSSEELRAVKPSMLQDFERGKRLEHEAFSGFLVREGKRLRVRTPINTILYELLCFLDQLSIKELNL
jgi:2-dehydropantoate 2-reductase